MLTYSYLNKLIKYLFEILRQGTNVNVKLYFVQNEVEEANVVEGVGDGRGEVEAGADG